MILSAFRTMVSIITIYYNQAFYALKDNRLRTLLSILGVTVGIAAVMVVASVSQGGRNHIYTELETFGLKSIWVYRDYEDTDPHRAVRPGTGIDNFDYETIRAGCCSALKLITPLLYGTGVLHWAQVGDRYSNSHILGVGADYPIINNDVLARGRFFREEDIIRKNSVVVIGMETRAELFGEQLNPIGRNIRIGGRKFMVMGVLKAKSRDLLASIGSARGQNANKRILMPYSVFQQMLGSKDIHVLQGQAVGLPYAELAASQLKNILGRRHGYRYVYKSDTMAQYISTAEKILKGVTIIGIVAASVSLFVGGMGIMNIMSTSVVERTREIGLRKALGAHRREILLQFVFEAMFISALGGIFGLVLGTVIGYLLVLVTGLPFVISWGVVALALFVSIGVGLVSGYYPAYHAASLRSVEALRYE